MVVVEGHVDLDLADGDRAFDTDGDVVGVVGYPDGHFFSAFEHRSLDEQGLEFDRAEFGIPGPDGFFSKIAHIQVIDLPVEEHSEVDLIAGFVVVEVDVPGVEGCAEDVLDAIFDGVDAGIGDGRMGRFYEGDVFVGLIAAFVDIADEFVGLQGGGVKIAFVFVADLEQKIVIALAFGDDVETVFALELLVAGVECGLTRGRGHAGQVVVDFVGQGFPGFECRIADTVTKVATGTAGVAGAAGLLCGVSELGPGIPGHYWKG